MGFSYFSTSVIQLSQEVIITSLCSVYIVCFDVFQLSAEFLSVNKHEHEIAKTSEQQAVTVLSVEVDVQVNMLNLGRQRKDDCPSCLRISDYIHFMPHYVSQIICLLNDDSVSTTYGGQGRI